ncbi:MAG TPA: FAD-binding oxidoreductase [Thermoplasmata archaeon]|nr:FAD-binding oxidoreductase [Thermoplasmata archaeon]
MSDRQEILVLGAGIAGAAAAHHLARRSLGPLTVYDPRTPSAGATGRAAGIVTEQMWDRWDFEVVRESRAEYARLAAERDPSAYRENGFARWTARTDIAAALGEAGERLRAWGANVRRIPSAELNSFLPAMKTEGILDAWFDPDDGVVTPSRLTEIYLESARAAGAEILLGEPFGGLRREGGDWTVSIGRRTVRSHRVLVAAGAWSKRLLASAGAPLPLAPYRTQAALLLPTLAQTAEFPSAHDLDLDVYLRPESNGRILAGDGTQLVEVDPETAPWGSDAAFVEHLAESVGARFPGWADADLVRAWAGVCVSTPDRKPLIGPVPGAEGLYALCGFNGFGVMRAGGAARRLAEAILAEGSAQAEEAIRPVLPSRFPAELPSFAPRPGFTLEGGLDPRF